MSKELPKLPRELIIMYVLNLDINHVMKLCSVSKRYNLVICQNPHFWRKKLEKDFGYKVISNDLAYLKSIYKINKEYQLSEHKGSDNFFISEGAALDDAAKLGYKDLMDYYIRKGAPLKYGYEGAALGGHKDLIDYLMTIKKPSMKELDSGKIGAAWGKHNDLVDFFIEKGALGTWDEVLEAAMSTDNKYMINLVKERVPEVWRSYGSP